MGGAVHSIAPPTRIYNICFNLPKNTEGSVCGAEHCIAPPTRVTYI